MSKPTEVIRQQWRQERIVDANAAAINGEGWKALAQKWSVTNACAFQWCRDNMPNDVCDIIGRNGKRNRIPWIGHTTDRRSKPKMEAHIIHPQPANQFCQYVWLDGGQLQRCLQPTEGHTYCADCLSAEGTKHLGSRFHSIRNNGKWSHVA